MSATFATTGLLNYTLNIEKMNDIANTHKVIVNEIKKFKPKSKTRKAFNYSYGKFLVHMESLDLVNFGFRMELGVEDAFGVVQKYFKSPVNDFNWGQIFEAVHFNIVK